MGFLHWAIIYFVALFAIMWILSALRNGKGPLSDLFNFILGLIRFLIKIGIPILIILFLCDLFLW